MKEQKVFQNPFSNDFLETWQLWKDFRKEEHNFSYKGVISEQMALKRLVSVSEGDEEKAIRIVEQSISRGWMDFYQLKQPNPNGHSKSKQSSTKTTATEAKPSLREQAANVFSMRNGKWEQPTGSDHSEAI